MNEITNEFKKALNTESRISTVEGKLNVLIGINAVNFFAMVGLILTVMSILK